MSRMEADLLSVVGPAAGRLGCAGGALAHGVNAKLSFPLV